MPFEADERTFNGQVSTIGCYNCLDVAKFDVALQTTLLRRLVVPSCSNLTEISAGRCTGVHRRTEPLSQGRDCLGPNADGTFPLSR